MWLNVLGRILKTNFSLSFYLLLFICSILVEILIPHILYVFDYFRVDMKLPDNRELCIFLKDQSGGSKPTKFFFFSCLLLWTVGV